MNELVNYENNTFVGSVPVCTYIQGYNDGDVYGGVSIYGASGMVYLDHMEVSALHAVLATYLEKLVETKIKCAQAADGATNEGVA